MINIHDYMNINKLITCKLSWNKKIIFAQINAIFYNLFFKKIIRNYWNTYALLESVDEKSL